MYKNDETGENKEKENQEDFMRSEVFDEDNNDETDTGFDPNKTAPVNPQGKKLEDKRDKKSRHANSATQVDTPDDFLATRVFVQGIPKDATWQDVSPRRSYVLCWRNHFS